MKDYNKIYLKQQKQLLVWKMIKFGGHWYLKVSILHFSDSFEFKSIQQKWINLVCQTQISNGVDRLDLTDCKCVRTEWWISTQTFETLKTQSCIDIVRKEYKDGYVNFLLNMSVSKINKSVVTIWRGHFMNAVLVNPGNYSCAVDAFL